MGPTNMSYLFGLLGAAVVFLAIDVLWLGVAAKEFYHKQLAGHLAEEFDLRAAGAFYLVYCVGMLIFAIAPAVTSGLWGEATLRGALFGFVCYATYDLTNLATLKGWPRAMAFIDIAWGAVLTATASTAGFFAAQIAVS